MAIHPLPAAISRNSTTSDRRSTPGNASSSEADDVVEGALAVAATQDCARALAEADHAFRKEQDVGFLRLFPLQAESRRNFDCPISFQPSAHASFSAADQGCIAFM